MFIVYTTTTHEGPQIFTVNWDTYEEIKTFFDDLCQVEEVVAAVLFLTTGEIDSTFNR